jgi:unsaturated rhamnogalacturonyl hydrolase
MNPPIGSIVLACLAACIGAAQVRAATPARPSEVLALMEKVADWQLRNPSDRITNGWFQATGYLGFMALADISPDPRFHDAVRRICEQNLWKPSERIYFAG